jgi:transcriptional regulator with XRE-family HTH domain
MSRQTHNYSPQTVHALRSLGRQILSQRKLQKITLAGLAERAGITQKTLTAIEKGFAGATVGTVFEVAWLVGIPLVGASEPDGKQLIDERLALLPSRVTSTDNGNDDF